jgi:hypothetical protein
MFLRACASLESTQILAFAGFCVFLSRIQAILSRFQFAYHASFPGKWIANLASWRDETP